MTHSAQPTARRIQRVEMEQIVKRFPGVLACDTVNFDIGTGEIHALLGENGAGKSTLMKVLYGLYQPEGGEIRINGGAVKITSPLAAIAQGIGMVHQHFMLVDTLTVAENVALGLPSRPLLDLRSVEDRIRGLSKEYGISVDPRAPVWTLSVGERQRVEIVKALYRGADLLILDEPTAVLTPQEVDELFVTLRQMTGEGHSLIFISHKLYEVLALADRITVLREGRLVGSMARAGVTRAQLARLMVGRDVLLARTHVSVPLGNVGLTIDQVSAQGVTGQPALRNVSLAVRNGEILGVAGVSGNGQRELAEVIAGLRIPTAGKVHFGAQDVTTWSAARRTASGLAYIPEERMHDGVIQEFSVAENLILQDHGRAPYSNRGFIDFREVARQSRALVDQYRVKTPTIDTTVKSLSGGNIQKLILARELARNPNVVIAAQPTRGVDIGATEYIHQRLLDQRLQGTATLLISEDLDEVLALSDRIAVIYEGRIMGIVERDATSAEELGLMMAGVAAGAA
jgi:simple sugar transport system ATP-binding protein